MSDKITYYDPTTKIPPNPNPESRTNQPNETNPSVDAPSENPKSQDPSKNEAKKIVSNFMNDVIKTNPDLTKNKLYDQFFAKPKPNPPIKDNNIYDYRTGIPEKEYFKYETEETISWISAGCLDYIFRKNDLDLTPESLKLWHKIFLSAIANLTLKCENSIYFKRFTILRNNKLENFITGFKKEAMVPFINDLFQNVYKNYIKELQFEEYRVEDVSYQKHPENFSDEIHKIYADFVCTVNLYNEISIQGLLDKVTDGEVTTSFIIQPGFHDHVFNYTLSPLASSISLFNSRLLTLKKDKGDNYYSKSSLPGVTYICFTGVFSEIDIDILHAFSSEVQIIMIYDYNTGGPSLLEDVENKLHVNRLNRKDFTKYSKNVLLLPIRTMGDGQKVLNSEELYNLFDLIVIKAIQNFTPDYIVWNQSFLFSENNLTPFSLTPEYFGRILNNLKKQVESRIIISPFILPTTKEKPAYDPKRIIISEEHDANLDPEFKAQLMNRQHYISKVYAQEYDQKYFSECVIAGVEVASSIVKFSKVKSGDFQSDKANPIFVEHLKLWAKIYHDHSEFHFITTLYQTQISNNIFKRVLKLNENLLNRYKDQHSIFKVETYASTYLAPVRKNKNQRQAIWVISKKPNNPNLKQDDETTNSQENYQLKGIHLSDIKFENKKTDSKKDEIKSLIMDENSQYYVHYDENITTIFMINFMDIQESSINYQNYVLEITEENKVLKSLPPCPELIKDFGMCYSNKKLFLVYGTKFSTSDRTFLNLEESSSIYMLRSDPKSGQWEWKKLAIRYSKKTLIPRHGVSVCSYTEDNLEYLVIFGGECLVVSKPELDTINMVEVLSSANLWESEAEFTVLEKEKLEQSDNVRMMPLIGGFCAYNSVKKCIYYMGSNKINNSAINWAFECFELTTEKKSPLEWTFKARRITQNKVSKVDYSTGNDKDPKGIPVPSHEIIAISDKNVNMIAKFGGDQYDILVAYEDSSQPNVCLSMIKKDSVETVYIKNDMRFQYKTRSEDNRNGNDDTAPSKLTNFDEKISTLPNDLQRSLEAASDIIDDPKIKFLLNEKIVNIEALREAINESSLLRPQMIDYKYGRAIKKLNLEINKTLDEQQNQINEKLAQLQKEEKSKSSDLDLDQESKNALAKNTKIIVSAGSRGEKMLNNYIDSRSIKFSNLESTTISNNMYIMKFFSKKIQISESQAKKSGKIAKSIIPKERTFILENKSNIKSIQATKSIPKEIVPSEVPVVVAISRDNNEKEAKKTKIVADFKRARVSDKFNKYNMFLNQACSSVFCVAPNSSLPTIQFNLKLSFGKQSHSISFRGQKNLFSICNSALICYLDPRYITESQPFLSEYKSWIFFANLDSKADFSKMIDSKRTYEETIELKPLIKTRKMPDVCNPTIFMNEMYIFGLGGTIYSEEAETPVFFSSRIMRIDFEVDVKLFDEDQLEFNEKVLTSSLEEKSNSFSVVQSPEKKLLYIVPETQAKYITLYNFNGIPVKKIKVNTNLQDSDSELESDDEKDSSEKNKELTYIVDNLMIGKKQYIHLMIHRKLKPSSTEGQKVTHRLYLATNTKGNILEISDPVQLNIQKFAGNESLSFNSINNNPGSFMIMKSEGLYPFIFGQNFKEAEEKLLGDNVQVRNLVTKLI